ncbi:MAG: hypothetical protein M1838_005198 [Thelocarpon superellum]|nr:MAG: hypothetical protein M1838_005198 [Thelocarpon superellum]
MNATGPKTMSPLSSALDQVVVELPPAMAVLLIPTLLLYAAIYALYVKGHQKTFLGLTVASIAFFWACPWLTPVHCGPLRCLQNFAIAIGSMKLLDLVARRRAPPRYTASETPPSGWLLSWIVLTELRYESFTPNPIRVPPGAAGLSEAGQLAIHLGGFAVLQALPQDYAFVLALEVLLAIYIIWTSIQLVLRYKTSPLLFGPLYMANSLSSFWSETWHNAFASPCESLAYTPLRKWLGALGFPLPAARSVGILGAFGLMAVFHVYALQPILPPQSLVRIGLFFVLNGVATVVEGAIWGRKKHWVKTAMAWIFEALLASWTAEEARIPHGLGSITWKDMCGCVQGF